MSYPADETSIEAVQQLCGNLFSALLVPLCENAASLDFEIPKLLRVSPRPEDMRGDSLVLVALTVLCISFFSRFSSACVAVGENAAEEAAAAPASVGGGVAVGACRRAHPLEAKRRVEARGERQRRDGLPQGSHDPRLLYSDGTHLNVMAYMYSAWARPAAPVRRLSPTT